MLHPLRIGEGYPSHSFYPFFFFLLYSSPGGQGTRDQGRAFRAFLAPPRRDKTDSRAAPQVRRLRSALTPPPAPITVPPRQANRLRELPGGLHAPSPGDGGETRCAGEPWRVWHCCWPSDT